MLSSQFPKTQKCELKMWCLLVIVLGLASGMDLEMEGDGGGDAAMDLEMDLDNVDLLDQQHPSTIAGRRSGTR